MRINVFLLMVLLACTNNKKTLPESVGESSEIIFVSEDALWKNLIEPGTKDIFCKSIEGINQPEPLFRISHLNYNEFSSILKRHTNIILISEGKQTSFEKNKWAKEQLVVQLNWQGDPKEFFEEAIKIKSFFVAKEIKKIKKETRKYSKKKVEQDIKDNFGIDCIIPKEYVIANNDSLFFWANFDHPKSDEIKNILVFSFSPKSTEVKEEVLEKTDSIFFKYLKGKKQGSFARIEPEYTPQADKNIYRGLWRLEKGFMGGPFVVKTYFVNQKIVVAIGFVFAPQKNKRKYIKEFEAIL